MYIEIFSSGNLDRLCRMLWWSGSFYVFRHYTNTWWYSGIPAVVEGSTSAVKDYPTTNSKYAGCELGRNPLHAQTHTQNAYNPAPQFCKTHIAWNLHREWRFQYAKYFLQPFSKEPFTILILHFCSYISTRNMLISVTFTCQFCIYFLITLYFIQYVFIKVKKTFMKFLS